MRQLTDRVYTSMLTIKQRLHNPDLSSSSEDDSSEAESNSQSDSGDDEDDPTCANQLIKESRKEAAEKARADRKANKKAAKAEAARMAAERRTKEVKLNRTGAISGAGAARATDKKCYECGESGHERRDCPRKKRQPTKKRGPPV